MFCIRITESYTNFTDSIFCETDTWIRIGGKMNLEILLPPARGMYRPPLGLSLHLYFTTPISRNHFSTSLREVSAFSPFVKKPFLCSCLSVCFTKSVKQFCSPPPP